MAFLFPWESDDPPPAPSPSLPNPDKRPTKRGRRPARDVRSKPSATTEPFWLYHHLTITGPAELIVAFAAAARGSGVIPWRLDGAGIEDDVFTLAISQPAARRSLTIDGCRILARQFRERVEAHQARAVALVGRSQACPFDLNVLLPVPATILQLGPTHPAALAWLTAAWGTTDRLRQVVERQKPSTGRRLPKHHTIIGYGFFTQGETPRSGIAQLAKSWPALRFLLLPRPAD